MVFAMGNLVFIGLVGANYRRPFDGHCRYGAYAVFDFCTDCSGGKIAALSSGCRRFQIAVLKREMGLMRPRVNFIKRQGSTVILYNAHMPAIHPARFIYATGVRDNFHFVRKMFVVGGNTQVFAMGNKTALVSRIVRGDAGRASVFVALERLYAAQRKHEPARR